MRRRDRAFTLIECMISLTIFCWVVTALFSVWSAHARALSKSQDYLVGQALAEQVMESQLALGYTAKDVPENSVTPFNVTHIVEGHPNVRQYFWSVQAMPVVIPGEAGKQADNMKQVTVQVRFYDENNTERIVKYSTVLSWEG